jgi:hypothetical protein
MRWIRGVIRAIRTVKLLPILNIFLQNRSDPHRKSKTIILDPGSIYSTNIRIYNTD